MWSLVRAELRESWPAWLGVSLGFIATTFSLSLAAMVTQSAILSSSAGVPTEESTAYVSQGAMNILLCAIIGLSVVGTSTQLVVDSRRGAVARLALAGTTPRGVVGTIAAQLAVVAAASAVLGDMLAIAVLRPVLEYLRTERASDSAGIATPPVVSVWLLLIVNLVWILVAMAAGLKQAIAASRIPPVEALRQSQGQFSVRRRHGVGRWISIVLATVVIVGLFIALNPVTAEPNEDTMQNVLQLSFLVLCIASWLAAAAAPVVVRPMTSAWTRIGPMRSAPWWMARATVLAKSDRLVRSVTPVMFAVALVFGMIGLPATFNATFAASGMGVSLEHADGLTFVVWLGLPLLIALTGSVGSLFMMSRQREAELAVFGITGATPGQRISTAALEAVMITVTATILGILVNVVTYAFTAYGVTLLKLTFSLEIPVVALLIALLITGAVTVASTTLPPLRTLSLPEPRVVARLISE